MKYILKIYKSINKINKCFFFFGYKYKYINTKIIIFILLSAINNAFKYSLLNSKQVNSSKIFHFF